MEASATSQNQASQEKEMTCQVCECELSSDEEDGMTCFDCIIQVSKGLDDIETGKLTDMEDVVKELG